MKPDRDTGDGDEVVDRDATGNVGGDTGEDAGGNPGGRRGDIGVAAGGASSHPDRFEQQGAQVLRQVAAGAPALALADRVAGAAADLVGMDAGSVCVLFAPQMSVPVGVSDVFAEMAERVQFTTGEGPCWAAYDTGAAMLIDDLTAGAGAPAAGRRQQPAGSSAAADREVASSAARQWPAYAVTVPRATGFRGVVSLPLRVALGVPVVLNLYSRDPLPALISGGPALGVLADGVRGVLDDASASGAAGGGRAWLEGSSTRRRAQVWVAESVLVERAPQLDAVAALAAMRTYCAVEGGTVDEVAEAVVTRTLDPARVLGLS